MWDKVKDLVGSVAPTLGTVLGGPLGGAAGKLIADKLGVENSPEKIQEALSTDPEAMVKIRELEAEKEVDLQRMAEKTERTYIDRQAAVYEAQAKSDGQSTRPKIAYLMAWMLTIPYVLIGVALTVNIYKSGFEVKEYWPVLLAYLGVPLEILRKYFGELRKEQGQRLGIDPSPLSKIMTKVTGRNG